MKQRIVCNLVLLCSIIISTLPANAQLKGTHLLGGVGLNAGTQPPLPSISLYVPNYWYSTTSLRNSNGDKAIANPDLSMFLTGLGATYISPFKIFNANYSANIILPFASNTIQGNYVNSKSSLAFSDIYLQPIMLGWHNKRADYIATYNLYIPTGKFDITGSDNSGLGMWAQELSIGTTQYIDPKKLYSFSLLTSFEINSEKKNTDIKPGNILTFEGGLARTFYKMKPGSPMPAGIFNAGLVYYIQYKVSDDRIPIGGTVYTGDKDCTYALGLEANATFTKSMLSLSARWLTEFGVKNRFQGNTLFVTIAKTLKVLEKPKK